MRRGAAIVEYGVLLAIVVAALVAMQIFVKRSMVGRLRGAADSIGEQYDPAHSQADITITVTNDTVTESEVFQDQVIDPINGTIGDVLVSTTTVNADQSQRTGSERIGPLGDNLWN